MKAFKYFYTILCLALLTIFPIATSKDTLSPTEFLQDHETLVSANGVFELGLFKSGRISGWYLGIWYKKIQEKTVVWVANRDAPHWNPSKATLKIGDHGNLVLVDGETGKMTWSSKETQATNPIVKLLDSGNLVLREANSNKDEFLWQSFDYPTNTLLPDMKLGWNLSTGLDRYITSWKSKEDPSTGDYSFKLNHNGFPEIFLWNKQVIKYRSGPWNGERFSGVPEMTESNGAIQFNFVVKYDEVYYSYSIIGNSGPMYSRLTVSSTGELERFTWIESTKMWNQYWYAPKDQCDSFKECGPYGICDSNASPVCKCLKGFEPKNLQAWNLRDGAGGCVRKTKLNCTNDKFLVLENMKLPESGEAFVNMNMSLEACKKMCLENCNCTGYADARISNGGSGCVMWTGELKDLRQYAEGGQNFHLRLAASELDGDHGKQKLVFVIVAIVVTIFTLLLLSGLCIYFLWKRNIRKTQRKGFNQRNRDSLLSEVVISSKKDCCSGERSNDELDQLPLFDFNTLAAASDDFSERNKLGQGGFGCVYKGTLVDGQEVAVKRLLEKSGQGTEEFKNEVELIARLQHRNLVRLLGCCIDMNEKMLIYEYLENKSLHSILFNRERRSVLDWKKRFNIICGIARGLVYLHHDSRLRIIHRDLKASNILLDRELAPKISDFGMARMFCNDQTEANTRRVVGTYGYMAPEYAMDGLFSIKSDVFSFGVLVLEIISGKKNKGFYCSNTELNVLGNTWKLWNEGKGLEMTDSSVGESYSHSEVLRCMQIGLLCVQERAEDRPTMSSVVLMLSSETATTMPHPKNPGFCLERTRNPVEADSSSDKQGECCSVNQVTVTTLVGR